MDEKTIKDTLLKDLYIRVPMAGYRLKPIYLNGNVYKNSYKYNHEGGNSKARNPKIQNMLRMIGFGEELVLPVPSPKTALANAPANAPVKMSDVLKNVLKDVLKDVLKELTERQVVILDFIIKDPFLSAKAISEKTSEKTSEKIGVTARTIESDLARLKKLGILTRKGGRKEGEWIIKVEK